MFLSFYLVLKMQVMLWLECNFGSPLQVVELGTCCALILLCNMETKIVLSCENPPIFSPLLLYNHFGHTILGTGQQEAS